MAQPAFRSSMLCSITKGGDSAFDRALKHHRNGLCS
jgi:hypothetical protein